MVGHLCQSLFWLFVKVMLTQATSTVRLDFEHTLRNLRALYKQEALLRSLHPGLVVHTPNCMRDPKPCVHGVVAECNIFSDPDVAHTIYADDQPLVDLDRALHGDVTGDVAQHVVRLVNLTYADASSKHDCSKSANGTASVTLYETDVTTSVLGQPAMWPCPSHPSSTN